MKDQIDEIIEKGLSYNLDMNEIGTTFSLILWYAIAWADGKIQEAEADLINDLTIGAGLMISDKGKIFLNEVSDYFKTQKPTDDSLNMVLDIISENDELPGEIKLLTVASLFGIANAHGGLFSKICRDEDSMLRNVCEKLDVDYNEARKMGEEIS
ncbi:MAG: hypothetical protein JW814_06665 [Candidatus Krumholzibacteriota bacterium]|nr:hypothetical protein [Candidatus Krumholzibacteriota bacterium]